MGTDQGDELNRRLDDGILFHKKYSDKKIIVSGGKGENKSLTEAELMYNYLVNNGISKDNIIKEPKATTSYENLIFVRKLVEKDAKFVIISSPYHLLRIRIVATRLDFNCYTKASGIRTHISGILREPFALVICLLFKK